MLSAKDVMIDLYGEDIREEDIKINEKLNEILSIAIDECIKIKVDSEINNGGKLDDGFWANTHDQLLSNFEYDIRHKCGCLEYEGEDFYEE